MATIVQKPLLSWEEVDRSSDLHRLQLVLEHLPDGELVACLERERGRGRDRYPVAPVWNAIVAGIVLQHPTVESLLRELRRNAELRQLCGFNPILGTAAVPSSFAMSRFFAVLMKHEDLVKAMFEELVRTLKVALPDLGRHLGFDGKAIPSFSTGSKDRATGQTSDPDADWGRKTYRGVDDKGRPWEKVSRWFGYQLHCVCPATRTQRRMAFWGFEEDRDTLRWRCPAAACGFECKGRQECERGALGLETSFGRVVRVKLDRDRRIFTPIPRDTPSWNRIYAHRTSVERVNSRLDQVFGFERHTIRGLTKMRVRVGYDPDPATPSQRRPPYLPSSTPDNPPNHLFTATGSPGDRSKDPHRNVLPSEGT